MVKWNKRLVLNSMRAEMIPSVEEQLIWIMHKLWNKDTITEEWSKCILVLTLKKRNLSQCSNYQTISLINRTGNIILIILLNRLKQQLECHLSGEQTDL